MRSLDSKVALISGGTGALGRAVSAAFVAAGAKVVATYVLERELPEFRAAVPSESSEVAKVDLLSSRAVNELVAGIVARHGRLDALLNIAGGFAGGKPLGEAPESELDDMLAMNLKTAYVCTRAALPVMQRQKAGRIINVTSRPALVGGANVAAYAIAKAGVAALTRAVADEVRDDGITVNAIAPSTIDTPANRAAMPSADPTRWVAVEQIAATLVFLASDAAAATTGAIIPIYGRS